MRVALPDSPQKIKLNMASIRNALKELGVDFIEGPKEFVTPCIFHPDHAKSDGGKPNLYINVRGKVGVFHCFKCDATGTFDAYVRAFAGWGPIKAIAFIRKHRATNFDEPDVPQKAPVVQITDEALKDFAYRHAYCYDRNLTEESLRRYKVGFDRDENAITLPWFDRVGRLVGVKRRMVSYKYNLMTANEDMRPHLYGLHLVRPNSIVWMDEGEFDTIYLNQTFRTASFDKHGAVGLGGKFLHPQAIESLLKKTPRAVVLALDNDDAGREAQDAIFTQLRGIVFTINLRYTGGKDPNELSVERVIRYAKLVENDIVEHETKTHNRFTEWKAQQQCVE